MRLVVALSVCLAAAVGFCGIIKDERFAERFPLGTVQRERVEKRLEIASRLPEMIRVEEARGDRTGESVAKMGREDVRRLEKLFQDELNAWKRYPLSPDAEPRRLAVADYGARGDGETDETRAFDEALAAVRGLGGCPCILTIPAGTYRFGKRGRISQFRAEGIENCVIQGDPGGAVRFRFDDYDAIGVELSSCTNVTLSGIEMTLTETPFSQGTVVAFDKESGCVDILHEAETLLPTDGRLAKRPNPLSCALFDARGAQVLGQEAFFDRRAERLTNGSYRVYLNRRHVAYSRLDVKNGWKIVICDRDNEFSMVRARGSYLCNFDHVTVLNSRAAAFALSGSYYPSLWHVRVVPRNAQLMVSSNADGAFLPRGAFVAHSSFVQTNDDGCNCLSYGRMIRDVENGNCVIAEGLKGNYSVGDIMLIVSSATGEFLWSGRVGTPGKVLGTKWHRTVFETRIPSDIKTLKSIGRSDWTQKEKRDLVHGRVHVDDMADQIYRPYAWGVSFVLSDCSFRSLRGTGAVVQCADALIENCRFERINSGVSITGLLEWNEGPAPYNVVVRNCTFGDVGVGVSSVYRNISGVELRTGSIRAVELRDNRFEHCRRNVHCPSLYKDFNSLGMGLK